MALSPVFSFEHQPNYQVHPETEEETNATTQEMPREEEQAETTAALRPQPMLRFLKQDSGPIGLESVIQHLGLPTDLFACVPAKTVENYRNHIAVKELHEVRRYPDTLRFVLSAAYCRRRRQEIIDTLVDLLIEVTHHMDKRAERRVEKDFVKDIKKVSDKTNLLFHLAEAAVDQPDGTIRDVIFPVVSEQTLRDPVKEYKASGSAYPQKVQNAMRGPYSRHYWRMVPLILKQLAFCSNNEVHQPVVGAVELLKKYVYVPLTQAHFASTGTVSLEDIVPTSWRKAVVTPDKTGKQEQVNRINYELCVLPTLCE